MGNEIQKLYDVKDSQQPQASGGHHLFWRVYSGVRKGTKEEVSIFVTDLKDIEKRLGTNKRFAPDVYKILKAGAGKLTRIHHPSVLKVIQPLQEGKTDCWFVTERVLGSVANFTGDLRELLPSNPLSKTEFTLLEKQYGMYQLVEALNFLHMEAKITHLNINPGSVFVTQKGDWKLAGFDFAIVGAEEPVRFTDLQVSAPWLFPDISYIAPEFLEGSPTQFSDVFALGLLAYQVMHMSPGSGACPRIPPCDFNSYRNGLYSPVTAPNISSAAWGALQGALQPVQTQRYSLALLAESELMNSMEVQALRFVSSLMEKDIQKKVGFLSELKNLIAAFPNRLIRHKVIPAVLMEANDVRMIQYIVPVLLACAEKLSLMEVEAQILPCLAHLMSKADLHPQIVYMLVQAIPLIVSKVSQESLRSIIIPFACRTMQTNLVPEVLVTLVDHFTTLTLNRVLNYENFKKDILPALMVCAKNVALTPVRVSIVKCFGTLAEYLDPDTIVKCVEPCVKFCMQNDASADLAVHASRVYKNVAQSMGADFIAKKLIPSVSPILVADSLQVHQFQEVVQILQEMISRVEKERFSQIYHKSSMTTLDSTQPTVDWRSEFAQGQSRASSTSSSTAPTSHNPPTGPAVPAVYTPPTPAVPAVTPLPVASPIAGQPSAFGYVPPSPSLPQNLPSPVPQTLPASLPQTLPTSLPQAFPSSVPQTLPTSLPQTQPQSPPQVGPGFGLFAGMSVGATQGVPPQPQAVTSPSGPLFSGMNLHPAPQQSSAGFTFDDIFK